ncbi:MAG: sporulation protein YabP [Clostridiaceae bacterium]|nr:sporulation protein YabP [Clostridiaceae bacterium]
MYEEKKKKDTFHNIIMENRKKLSISGVSDVESFDEESVILYTEYGDLTIKGEELHINKLSIDTGEVVVEGEIHSLSYDEHEGKSKGAGLFSRMFR